MITKKSPETPPKSHYNHFYERSCVPDYYVQHSPAVSSTFKSIQRKNIYNEILQESYKINVLHDTEEQ